MSDFPRKNDILDPVRGIISTYGPHSSAGPFNPNSNHYSVATGTAAAIASRATYMPVIIPTRVTIYDMAILVGTKSGNLDIGIYSESGTQLYAAGSTAVGEIGIQTFTLGSPLTVSPGVYWIALVTDNTTAKFAAVTSGNIAGVLITAFGVQQQSSAFPLPSTATFSNATDNRCWLISASAKPVI